MAGCLHTIYDLKLEIGSLVASHGERIEQCNSKLSLLTTNNPLLTSEVNLLNEENSAVQDRLRDSIVNLQLEQSNNANTSQVVAVKPTPQP